MGNYVNRCEPWFALTESLFGQFGNGKASKPFNILAPAVPMIDESNTKDWKKHTFCL
jgi:hypothetical protein